LVPLRARAEFSRSLGQKLQNEAIAVAVQQQHRVRWLMVGGMVGSLLSVLGLLAAWLLRRRNGQGHSQVPAKKPLGAA
jgi:hypothetical protein